jgi:hypothetical protein
MIKDAYSIKTADEYSEVRKILSKKEKPHKVMCLLMNALESYRQARKLGWSRPWNKYDLTVFQSFKINFERDQSIISLASDLLKNDLSMPTSARYFVNELLADQEHLMGFIFVHDYQQAGQTYEGVTLSLGRIHDKKFRDRVDIILESPLQDGHSAGLSRIRLYVDPYTGIKEPLWSSVVEKNIPDAAVRLFHDLSDVSWQWSEDAQKHWNHWTSTYISYFGERKLSPDQAYFYVSGKPKSKLRVKTDEAA